MTSRLSGRGDTLFPRMLSLFDLEGGKRKKEGLLLPLTQLFISLLDNLPLRSLTSRLLLRQLARRRRRRLAIHSSPRGRRSSRGGGGGGGRR